MSVSQWIRVGSVIVVTLGIVMAAGSLQRRHHSQSGPTAQSGW
jgi:hypothetical protein